jgi:hypothetical protein
MSNTSAAVKLWRQRTKNRIVESFGGKCNICNYNRCPTALELHHLDPSKKNFSFGSVRADPKKWDVIVEELRKCIMLCANCHREVHSGFINLPENLVFFNEDFVKYQSVYKKADLNECPICKNLKNKRLTTCSKKCSAKLSFGVDWNQFNLYDLHVVQKLPNTKIAKLVGCSDAAVIKRLKKLKIYKISLPT